MSAPAPPAPAYCVLPDGRRLAYAEAGDPGGRPVFYCHGFPGSRAEARLVHAAAAGLGIRLIAPDRPGFGASDPAPGRTLGGWPPDLAALADHLGVGRFHLVGLSGGGPYALASAARLGERLAAVAVVSGLGELAPPGALDGMAWPNRRAIGLQRRLPRLARWLYGGLAGPLFAARPEYLYRLMATHLAAADRAVLSDAGRRDAILGSFAEAFRQGGAGPAFELGLYTRPWDFDPRSIRIPLYLWHGEADTIVPVAMGRRHAALVPGCRAHFLPGEGHFSLVLRQAAPILRELTAV